VVVQHDEACDSDEERDEGDETEFLETDTASELGALFVTAAIQAFELPLHLKKEEKVAKYLGQHQQEAEHPIIIADEPTVGIRTPVSANRLSKKKESDGDSESFSELQSLPDLIFDIKGPSRVLCRIESMCAWPHPATCSASTIKACMHEPVLATHPPTTHVLTVQGERREAEGA
jgi:hypothetical protein